MPQTKANHSEADGWCLTALNRLPTTAQLPVGVTRMQAFHRAYGGYPLQCQGICGHVDKDAGVYDVVRGVEYATFRDRLAVARVGEHVVGATGDDAAAQL